MIFSENEDISLPDGSSFTLKIPEQFKKSAPFNYNITEYEVFLVAKNKSQSIAEIEFYPIVAEINSSTLPKKQTIGALIPGAGLLSSQNPNNENKIYCAYSLITSRIILNKITNNDFTHSKPKIAKTADLFLEELYYLIIHKVHHPDFADFRSDFIKNYEASFFSHGLIFFDSTKQLHPNKIFKDFDTAQKNINIKKETSPLTPIVKSILIDNTSHAENGFLKFFYAYQVIEHLMTSAFATEVSRLTSHLTNPSSPQNVVDIRDVINSFQKATKEESRIKAVFNDYSTHNKKFAEDIFSNLSLPLPENMGEMVYKIRNIIFHDYPRIKHLSTDVEELANCLIDYLTTRKLLLN